MSRSYSEVLRSSSEPHADSQSEIEWSSLPSRDERASSCLIWVCPYPKFPDQEGGQKSRSDPRSRTLDPGYPRGFTEL
eukprot:5693578-Prymnesium_polylepis.3